MRILTIITKDGDFLDMAYRLKQEGHDVKIAILEKDFANVGGGFGIKKVRDWRKELTWVGKTGLIIFDQSGLGKEQDDLRKAGYSVVGGSEGADRLEFDRYHAQKVFKRYGMKTVPLRYFNSIPRAIEFVKKNKGKWVIKQSGHIDKCFSYVGEMDDGSDVIDILQNYKKHNVKECQSFYLQEKVEGVELAVTRYFNGYDWIGPIMMNIEHKRLFPYDIGPNTPEMGTLMWFDKDDNKNKLFTETLARIRPYLAAINFRGCFDINCIVNEKGAVPLEATPRFGYPTIQVEAALTLSPWGEFLKAIADGKTYDFKWRKGFGIVVLLAVPPFPYEAINNKYNPRGLRISFTSDLTQYEWKHIHFSEVSRKLLRHDEYEFVVSAGSGYVMCVTGFGKSVEDARRMVYKLAKKVVIPKMFYRLDIGLKFIEKDRLLLKKWGYL